MEKCITNLDRNNTHKNDKTHKTPENNQKNWICYSNIIIILINN